MNTEAFVFNSSAKYAAWGVFKEKQDLAKPWHTILVHEDDSFQAYYPDVYEKYLLPLVRSAQVVKAWNINPFQFWQNQVNFAVWCSTSGCGVSIEDHLQANDPMIQSLYRFQASI